MGEKRSSGLTPRQREWLVHLRACARSGETVRAYAKRHALSEHAMYQATKDLRRRGVLPAHSGRPRQAKTAPAFVKVSAAVRSTSSGPWRARLPNGIVLEGSEALGPELLEALAAL
jgi:uncharacterized protein